MTQHPYSVALLLILGIAVASWIASVVKKDVSFVDSLWSLFFLAAALVFAAFALPLTVRGMLVVSLVALWALRL